MKEDIEKLKEFSSLLKQNILNIEEFASDFDEDFYWDLDEAISYLKEGRDVLDWIVACLEYRLKK